MCFPNTCFSDLLLSKKASFLSVLILAFFLLNKTDLGKLCCSLKYSFIIDHPQDLVGRIHCFLKITQASMAQERNIGSLWCQIHNIIHSVFDSNEADWQPLLSVDKWLALHIMSHFKAMLQLLGNLWCKEWVEPEALVSAKYFSKKPKIYVLFWEIEWGMRILKYKTKSIKN